MFQPPSFVGWLNQWNYLIPAACHCTDCISERTYQPPVLPTFQECGCGSPISCQSKICELYHALKYQETLSLHLMNENDDLKAMQKIIDKSVKAKQSETLQITEKQIVELQTRLSKQDNMISELQKQLKRNNESSLMLINTKLQQQICDLQEIQKNRVQEHQYCLVRNDGLQKEISHLNTQFEQLTETHQITVTQLQEIQDKNKHQKMIIAQLDNEKQRNEKMIVEYQKKYSECKKERSFQQSLISRIESYLGAQKRANADLKKQIGAFLQCHEKKDVSINCNSTQIEKELSFLKKQQSEISAAMVQKDNETQCLQHSSAQSKITPPKKKKQHKKSKQQQNKNKDGMELFPGMIVQAVLKNNSFTSIKRSMGSSKYV